MAFIPLPQGVKLCFHFTLDSIPVSFCVYVDTGGTVDQSVTDDVANVGLGWWEDHGYLAFSNRLLIQEIVATDVSQQPAYQSTVTSFTHTTGNVAQESMPNGTAIVVTLRTGYIGRSYRGRLFLPGIDHFAVVENTLTSAAQNNIQTVFEALQDHLSNASMTWVVASYQNNLSSRETAVGTPVTSILVRDNVKSQRRRNLLG